jgi:SAM-dependent methyltransferase
VTDFNNTGQALSAWFDTSPGKYLLDWEQSLFDATVPDLFGFNAIQLGLHQLDALRSNRMPHRWFAAPECNELEKGTVFVSHAAALPFSAHTLDLVVLPHTLELSADPHAVLREVERCLVPEGRVLITGFNPLSLWGLRQYRASAFTRMGLGDWSVAARFMPEPSEFIAAWRLKDWLKVLSFDIESVSYGCYRPPVRSEKWLNHWAWMDRLGSKTWPFMGAVYFILAVKRVKGLHLLGPSWKPLRPKASAVTVAQKPSLKTNVVQTIDKGLY